MCSKSSVASNAYCFPQERHAVLSRRAHRLQCLSNIFLELYYCEGPEDLLKVVEELNVFYLDHAVAQGKNPNIVQGLTGLGVVYYEKCELLYDLKALDSAISCYQRALSVPGNSCNTHSELQIRLAGALAFRYRTYSHEKDYDSAKRILADALELLMCRSVDNAWLLTLDILATHLPTFWKDLNLTVTDLQHMLESLTRSTQAGWTLSQQLRFLIVEAKISHRLLLKTKSQGYLQRGLRACHLALGLCDDDAEITKFRIQSIILCLHEGAYQASDCGSQMWNTHIDPAISISHSMRVSKLARPDRNPHMCWKALHACALITLDRANHYDDINGREQAIDYLKHAITVCPRTYSTHPVLVNHLAYALRLYFEQCGRVSALDEMIGLAEPYPDYVRQAPGFACNIADAFLLRAQTVDSETARSLIRRAIEICRCRSEDPSFDDDENKYLLSTKISASRMQLQLGHQPILEPIVMIELSRECLRESIEGFQDSELLGLILAQIDALTSLACDKQDVSYLLEAEDILKNEIAGGIIKAPMFLVDIFGAQADLFIALSDFQDANSELISRTRAWDAYYKAATASSSRGKERLRVCLRWASHAVDRNNPQEALKAYSHAIQILPSVVFLGEDILGRIEALRQVTGIAMSSASIALSLGDLSAAPHFLENARGILWHQCFQARVPHMATLPPELRNQIIAATRVLDKADRLQWSIRRRQAEELEELALKVRALPGFERFSMPPLLHEIEAGLDKLGGLAIVLIPSKYYCDVIVLAPNSQSSHLRIESFNMCRMGDLSRMFHSRCMNAREAHRSSHITRAMKLTECGAPFDSASDVITSVLTELWVSLVHPILGHLAMLGEDKDRKARRRVWWCPVGPSSSLPWHAAGVYTGTAQDCVGNYMVSSYTPTLAALHRLLSMPRKGVTVAPSMLLIAESDAGNHPSLPNVHVEVDLVQNLAPPECIMNTADLKGMSVYTALTSAGNAHILHLACHGQQDQENPLNSGFELSDGRLTVAELMQVNADQAQLAYLSVCESAGTDEGRPDEGLNLVGTMIFVGFRSVIGTLWAMDDMDGPFMAEQIYSRIFQSGALDMTAVPYAIDDAVKKLRESGVPASRWATYVHFGV